MWLGTGDHCARASQIMIPLPRPMPYSTTARSSNALAVHASVRVVVVRLGIGELQLRKKGLLPEMQLLAEISYFYAKVILPRRLRTLVPSATKKTAESVS